MLRNWVYSIKTCLFSNEQAWANPTFGFIFKHLIMNRTLKIESKIVWIFIIWTRTIYNPFPNTYLFSKFCNFLYWSLLFVIWEKLELMHPLSSSSLDFVEKMTIYPMVPNGSKAGNNSKSGPIEQTLIERRTIGRRSTEKTNRSFSPTCFWSNSMEDWIIFWMAFVKWTGLNTFCFHFLSSKFKDVLALDIFHLLTILK